MSVEFKMTIGRSTENNVHRQRVAHWALDGDKALASDPCSEDVGSIDVAYSKSSRNSHAELRSLCDVRALWTRHDP